MPGECEGVMGFPRGWTQLEVPNEDEDVDSPRYHALGNAVNPPVIATLAQRIEKYLRTNPAPSGAEGQ
jgi:DNA (cytosine-5)-methyltransferase 1